VRGGVVAQRAGGLDCVTPGSSCIVNAYTSNHDRIAAKDTGAFKRVAARTTLPDFDSST
jgi:hypothetical protein